MVILVVLVVARGAGGGGGEGLYHYPPSSLVSNSIVLMLCDESEGRRVKFSQYVCRQSIDVGLSGVLVCWLQYRMRLKA